MKTWILLTLVFAGLHLAGAAPKQYTPTELPPANGADFMVPWRISNRGDVAGHLDFSTGPFKDDPHAAFYRQGTTIDLHPLAPGGDTNTSSLPTDLNDRGDVIFDTDGYYFIYRHGQVEEAPQLPEPDFFAPTALNNAGWIAGTIFHSNANPRAVLYKQGAFIPLASPESVANDINNRGQVVGRSDSNGVIFTRKKIVDLGAMPEAIRINERGDVIGYGAGEWNFYSGLVRFKDGREVSLPFNLVAINNRGEIVGSMFVADGDLNSHAVLHVDGVTLDLNEVLDPMIAKVIYAYDINDHGQIVCWGRMNDHWAGILLTPTK